MWEVFICVLFWTLANQLWRFGESFPSLTNFCLNVPWGCVNCEKGREVLEWRIILLVGLLLNFLRIFSLHNLLVCRNFKLFKIYDLKIRILKIWYNWKFYDYTLSEPLKQTRTFGNFIDWTKWGLKTQILSRGIPVPCKKTRFLAVYEAKWGLFKLK